jgi:hypothetical protein
VAFNTMPSPVCTISFASLSTIKSEYMRVCVCVCRDHSLIVRSSVCTPSDSVFPCVAAGFVVWSLWCACAVRRVANSFQVLPFLSTFAC